LQVNLASLAVYVKGCGRVLQLSLNGATRSGEPHSVAGPRRLSWATIEGSASEGIKVMNGATKEFDQNDEDFFTISVSDDALEAAASPTAGAAMSFPNAPTVSILFACCGND
jgi:hypothetical protein